MTKLTIAKHFRISLKKDIGNVFLLVMVPKTYNITTMTQEPIIKHFRIPTNRKPKRHKQSLA